MTSSRLSVYEWSAPRLELLVTAIHLTRVRYVRYHLSNRIKDEGIALKRAGWHGASLTSLRLEAKARPCVLRLCVRIQHVLWHGASKQSRQRLSLSLNLLPPPSSKKVPSELYEGSGKCAHFHECFFIHY